MAELTLEQRMGLEPVAEKKPGPPTALTPEARALFLEALRETCNVAYASKVVGISRQTLYKHRKNDKTFEADWDDAIDFAMDNLEGEAYRRAHEGTAKPVFYKGDLCGHVQEFSDGLTQFLMKAHRPEKYRERVDLKHTGDLTINVTDGD